VRRALLGLLALSLSGCWLIGFDSVSPPEQQRREARSRVSPLATPIQDRQFVRVEISPDGLFRIDGHRPGIATVDGIAFPKAPPAVWLLASSAPTHEALASLGALLDRARAEGAFLNAIVARSPAGASPTDGTPSPATPRVATIDAEGLVTLSARREGSTEKVPAARVREQLPSEGCAPADAIGLAPTGASTAQLMDVAGFLAAAGCRVVIVTPGVAAPAPR